MQEAIPILYPICKNVKNLLAVLAWMVWLAVMEVKNLLLETVIFSTEEESFIYVGLNKALKHTSYLTFTSVVITVIVPFLQE